MQRTGWVFLLLLFASTLHALSVEVPGSFTISAVARQEGNLVLPSERTYQNIRILDRGTYRFVSSCEQPCVQPLTQVVPTVAEVRPAKTRKGMWIVQVDFNHAWLITFLVFQKEKGYNIKPPQDFKFLSDALAMQTREAILQAIRQEEK